MRSNQILIQISRILYLGLAAFELLNFFKILNFTLDFSWLGLVITSLGIWIIAEMINLIIQRKHIRDFRFGLAMLIGAIPLYLDALGDILHFYSRFAWYDQIAHLSGGLVAALGIWIIIASFNQYKLFKLGNLATIIFSTATTTMLLVFYELEEYLEDYFTKSQRLGDGFDTANDLLLGFLGALLTATIFELAFKNYFFKKPSSKTPDSEN
jgi:hypothetical protein